MKVLLTGALLETGGRLLQVSTDFVFNGSQGSPYSVSKAASDHLVSAWHHTYAREAKADRQAES